MLKLLCPGLEYTLLELTPGSSHTNSMRSPLHGPQKSEVQYIKVTEINYMLDKEPLHIVNTEMIWNGVKKNRNKGG